MDQDAWLWLYIAAMAAGAILFTAWSRQPKGVPHYEYAAAIFIPVWSGLAYLSMVLGMGTITVDGREIYIARYADWIVTTPLLVMALVWTAYFYGKKDYSVIAAVVGADIIMILSGLMADLASDPRVQWIWFTIGCVSLAVLVYSVWFRLRRVAQDSDPGVARAYDISAGMLTALWLGYPLIWALGPSGIGAIERGTEVILFVLLPIVSKVGFSIVDLSMLRKLGSKKPAHGFHASQDAGALDAA